MKRKDFEKRYGNSFGVELYFAPGRVNLIGEHVDYNGGLVFPCALSYGTYLYIRKTDDNLIKFASMNLPYRTEIPLSELGNKTGEWVDYPLGIFHEMAQRGMAFSGLEVLVYGNIPNGAGLSSSASLELLFSYALNDLYGGDVSMLDMIKLSVACENDFVGVNCGVMDQYAIGYGKKDHATAIDCSALTHEYVPLELGDYKIVIGNTCKRRGLADSKYNERRAECDSAVEDIQKVQPIELLCELSEKEFNAIQGSIQDETIFKRARHAVYENARVIRAISVLKKGDLKTFGALMNDSHDSLKNDYEVTGIELDTMVDAARKCKGVLGARMTGAGFGGCIVSLVHADSVDDFTAQVRKEYEEKTGLIPEFYIADVGNGPCKVNAESFILA